MRACVLSLLCLTGLHAAVLSGLQEARGDLLDPSAFASLGVFDPTTPGTYTIKLSNGPPSIVDPNGQTVVTGVESNGIAVFDFDSISITSTASSPIQIVGGLAAFLSRGDISVTNTAGPDWNGPYVNPYGGPYIFNFNGETAQYASGGGYGPGAGGNGNPWPGSGIHQGQTFYTGGGGGGFGGAGSPGEDNIYTTGGAAGTTYGDLSKALEGGSGGGSAGSVPGGTGGGALELGALGTIQLVGMDVGVLGGPGANNPYFDPSAGGGGGSGGGILVHAPTVIINASDQSPFVLVAGGGPAGQPHGGGNGGGGRVYIATDNFVQGDPNIIGVSVGGFNSNPGVFTIAPLAVPEPGSGLLVGLGFATLMVARRLRRKSG